ncbi:MAG: 4Fe-4S dicluster domain-containing protein [Candidatus Azobacteroides sp.]|nr:4Fe-4S dicluster domain-containing protein [Candidatus Azobacteroides sp.]
MNKLKSLRVIIALFFILLITLFFVDFNNLLPTKIHGLLHLQLVPAMLAGSVLVVVFLLLLTLFFGRVYCSFICPAGIFQDIFIRLSKRGHLKKNKRKRKFTYHKPSNILRYSLLGLTVILFIFGSIHLLLYLDPYSNYGRIAANIFRPVVIFGNNLLAKGLMLIDNYSLSYTSIYNVTVSALIASIAIFLLFGILPVIRGRLFCNTLCPVGAFLSVFSRYSFFRISFDEETCNNCGLCERSCKAECINSKEQTVDVSRCVSCFNCLSSCKKKNAIHYRFAPVFWKKEKKASEIKIIKDNPVSESRRSFLALSGTILATIPFLNGCTVKKNESRSPMPVLPPGAKNLDRFSLKCTACHLCVAKCPNQIIQPAALQYGLGFLLQPRLVFRHGYCNYECTVCTEVCPNGALKKLTKEEKAQTQLGIAHFTKESCIVYLYETDCGACAEHCPTRAVEMVPYKDSLRIPHVTPDICVGCGGCEYICPARPERAMNVIAGAAQGVARKPDYEKVKEVKDVGFGF